MAGSSKSCGLLVFSFSLLASILAVDCMRTVTVGVPYNADVADLADAYLTRDLFDNADFSYLASGSTAFAIGSANFSIFGLFTTASVSLSSVGRISSPSAFTSSQMALRVQVDRLEPLVMVSSVTERRLWLCRHFGNTWTTIVDIEAAKSSPIETDLSNFTSGRNGFGSAVAMASNATYFATIGYAVTPKGGAGTLPRLVVWEMPTSRRTKQTGGTASSQVVFDTFVNATCKQEFPCFQLAFSDDVLIVSIVGNPLFVFGIKQGGWLELQRLTSPSITDAFGASLAATSLSILAGDPGALSSSGKVMMFMRNREYFDTADSDVQFYSVPVCEYDGVSFGGLGSSLAADEQNEGESIVFVSGMPSANGVIATLLNTTKALQGAQSTSSNDPALLRGGFFPPPSTCGYLSLLVPDDYLLGAGAGTAVTIGGQRVYFNGPGVYYDRSTSLLYESAFCFPGEEVKDIQPFDISEFRVCGKCTWTVVGTGGTGGRTLCVGGFTIAWVLLMFTGLFLGAILCIMCPFCLCTDQMENAMQRCFSVFFGALCCLCCLCHARAAARRTGRSSGYDEGRGRGRDSAPDAEASGGMGRPTEETPLIEGEASFRVSPPHTSITEGEGGAWKDHVCKICFVEMIEVVLGPCGHEVLCLECAKRLTSCPICRTKVAKIVKVY